MSRRRLASASGAASAASRFAGVAKFQINNGRGSVYWGLATRGAGRVGAGAQPQMSAAAPQKGRGGAACLRWQAHFRSVRSKFILQVWAWR